MLENKKNYIMCDDSPMEVSSEVNFIWSIANKLGDRIKVTNIKM